MEQAMFLNKIEVFIMEKLNSRIHAQSNTSKFYKSWDDSMLKIWFGLKTPQTIGRGGKISKLNKPNCKWSPLESGWFKMNFDGGSRGNLGSSSVGCVIFSC